LRRDDERAAATRRPFLFRFRPRRAHVDAADLEGPPLGVIG